MKIAPIRDPLNFELHSTVGDFRLGVINSPIRKDGKPYLNRYFLVLLDMNTVATPPIIVCKNFSASEDDE